MSKIILSDLYIGNFPTTQEFGARPSYYSQFGLKGHEGQDKGMPNGTPLICPFDEAIVVRVVRSLAGAYGKHIVLWDSVQKAAVWYCHCQTITREVGGVVYKHNLVATSNNTGNSTGPHLHWSVCRTDSNGVRTNQDNGYIGMLDSRNNVDWRIENPSKPTEGDTSMGEISPDHQACLDMHEPLVNENVKLKQELVDVRAEATAEKEDFRRDKERLENEAEARNKEYKDFLADVAIAVGSTQNESQVVSVLKSLVKHDEDAQKAIDKLREEEVRWNKTKITLEGEILKLKEQLKTDDLSKHDFEVLLSALVKKVVALIKSR